MRALPCVALLFASLHGPGLARAADDTFDRMLRDMEPTWVTFGPTSLHLPGSHLRSDTAAYSVEANIAPPLPLLRGVAGGPLPGAWLLAAVPKFLVRRSDGLPSNPVRTPDYQPSVTFHYAPLPADGGPPGHRYLSLTLLHHSNGQTGPFLGEDGLPNTVDGSFSLWSAAATLHLRDRWPLLPEYKALRIERLYRKEGPLRDLYPDWVASLNLGTAERSLLGPGPLRGTARLAAGFDWRPRTAGALPASLKPTPFSGTILASYAPGWASHPPSRGRASVQPDLALFARAYGGYDYYNMNFHREVYRLDLGLMLGPAAFTPSAARP